VIQLTQGVISLTVGELLAAVNEAASDDDLLGGHDPEDMLVTVNTGNLPPNGEAHEREIHIAWRLIAPPSAIRDADRR
jgi:hypothetical protein